MVNILELLMKCVEIDNLKNKVTVFWIMVNLWVENGSQWEAKAGVRYFEHEENKWH